MLHDVLHTLCNQTDGSQGELRAELPEILWNKLSHNSFHSELDIWCNSLLLMTGRVATHQCHN